MNVNSNLQGDRGSVWVSDNFTLVRFDDERPVVSIKGPNWATVQVWGIAPNGTILVGGGWGLARGRTEEFIRIPEVYGNVQEIALDDETIWVTTSDKGLFHFNGQTWTHIDWLDGFPMDGANEILIDPQGVVWVGGKEGLVSVRVVAR